MSSRSAPTAITIGSLDGVHLGHRALLSAARGAVGEGGRVVAMVFDPHPLTALNPAAAPARLSAWSQRERWLREAGADEVVRLEPTPALLNHSAVEFIAEVVRDYRPAVIVEGPDFHFGKGRAGDTRTLAALGQEGGFATIVLSAVEAVLTDHTIARCSSSLVRRLVSAGRVGDAAAVLGRPYALLGEVVRGDRRGRTIGFPTANIRTDQLLPADGVYAATARFGDGRTAPAAVNIGPRPTFSGVERRVEAHLIGLAGAGEGEDTWSNVPGVPEYGWEIELSVLTFLRDSYRFESVDALRSQLRRDCRRAAEVCGLKAERLGAMV